MTVAKAIIPAAGLGTRMRSLAGDLPKELLEIGANPSSLTLSKALPEAASPGRVDFWPWSLWDGNLMQGTPRGAGR
jgi:UTP-glucose-1-phosphate uridylyltransferase